MVALQASNGPGAVRSVLAPSSKARSPDRSFLFPVYLLRCFGWLASCLAGPELRWPSTYKNLERSFARARAPRARANTFHKVSMITKRERAQRGHQEEQETKLKNARSTLTTAMVTCSPFMLHGTGSRPPRRPTGGASAVPTGARRQHATLTRSPGEAFPRAHRRLEPMASVWIDRFNRYHSVLAGLRLE